MAPPLDSAMSRPSSGAASPTLRFSPRSRTQSISSDRPSTVGHSLMSPPSSVSPEPAFIAASAASQIVTNDHDSHAETWYDQHGIEPSGETAPVSPAALQLVNNFLDQLLFNFLSISRATTLSALRPAVSEVLKPKLAKDAISQADEELREYLGGDDEDAAQSQAPNDSSPADWDLELAWKRTRLRCMVYSSLGDMEEEDEDYYMEQGHLDVDLQDRFSETVSPAVAIFLTSILEFLGEQALIIAGQAAYHRMRLKYEKELRDNVRTPTGVADKIVVGELDMERVALDRTLGRLWRAWKKKIRSPAMGSVDRLNRSYSKDSLFSASSHLRSTSSAAELAVPATVPEPEAENQTVQHELQGQEEKLQGPPEEYLTAAAIALPMGLNDIAEIELPGLALCSDNEASDSEEEESTRPARPKSMVILPLDGTPDSPTPTLSRPQASRKRSNSVPAPAPPRHLASTTIPIDEPETTGGGAVGGSQVLKAESAPESDEIEPGSGQDNDEDEDDEISIEEPRIVRSSRVSILGRSTSTASSEQRKLAAINTNLPTRTPSIHSARLIDVGSPRSPGAGSQRSSVGPAESIRLSSPARTTRTATPPVSDDQPGPSPDSLSAGRFGNHTHKSGLATSMSVSETEEAVVKDLVVPAPAGPTPDRQNHATSIPPQPVTKVTILPNTNSHSASSSASSVFYIEPMPPLTEGREVQDKSRYQSPAVPLPPIVPERSAGRQAVANTSAVRQPATIGQVSVERSRARSPIRSQGSSSRPRETSAGRTRQQPASGSPTSAKFKAVRTSEEDLQAQIDVVRNFEELIQSDQTIQFTLTPESMRDLDSRSARSIVVGSPVVSLKTRKSEDARQTGSRSRSSSVTRNDARTPPAPRSSGSGSYSSNDAQPTNRSFSTGAGKHSGAVPRSIPPMPSKQRASGLQARDARLARDSLADLAEFIRSTGPPSSSVTTTNPFPGLGKMCSRDSALSPNLDGGAQTPSMSLSNRPKLQARGATVDYKDGNSDLIDFIRRGPPGAGGSSPRIPRDVAPFRTTMDSDQMSGAVGGRAVDAQLRELDVRSSQASTHATEYSLPPSIQSSVNSHSALLTKNKPISYDTVDGDMPMPKRKTRRVRDPYAIDFSDEELDEDEVIVPQPKPKRAQTNEESLMDFLNNYPPPPEPIIKPFNIPQTRNMPPPPSKGNASLKPKKSAPSLMARLTRRDSSQSAAKEPASPKVPALPAASRSLNSRASGGHIPIQVNIPSGSDFYSPPSRAPSSKAAAMMGGAPPAVGGSRVPMKKFEPRDPVSVPSRGTSDLADFFKNSGPPPGPTPMVHQFPEPVEREQPAGGSRLWGRRRKPSMS
ncbi:hypothetical protein N0V88_000867 [Collariella sp. IMI 366227]|nr:hypothetical protein N0V88_000867 [Collariella sp. IMI 366227]